MHHRPFITTPSWDTNVENVQPHGKGVDPAALDMVGDGGGLNRAKLDAIFREEMERFNKELRDVMAATGTSDREAKLMLQLWLQHLSNTKRIFVAGHQKIKDRLMACFEALRGTCKKSERFLNVCIELATVSKDATEIFDFMIHHEICVEFPKFHFAVAVNAETRSDYQSAERAYDTAVRLAQEHKKAIHKLIGATDAQRDDAVAEVARMVKMRDHFKRRLAKRQLAAPLPPPSQAAAGQRSLASSQTARAFGGPLRTSPTGLGMRISPRAGLAPQATNVPAEMRKPFAVFSDRKMMMTPSGTASSSSSTIPSSSNSKVAWNRLPGPKNENFGPISSWAGVTLDTKPRTTATRTTSSTAGFKVFEDVVDTATTTTHPPLPEVHASSLGNLLDEVKVVAPSHHSPAMSNSHDDVTFNTRLALNDMFDMFASPSMSIRGGGDRTGRVTTVRPTTTTTQRRETQPVALLSRFSSLQTPAAATTLPRTLVEEGENVSPNIEMVDPSSLNTSLARHRTRPTTTTRPALRVVQHIEENVSPSFRAELARKQPQTGEAFQVYVDDDNNNNNNADATYMSSLSRLVGQPDNMEAEELGVVGEIDDDNRTYTARGGLFDFSLDSSFQIHNVDVDMNHE